MVAFGRNAAGDGAIAITGVAFASPVRSKTYGLEVFGDYLNAGAPPGVGHAVVVQGDVRCELRLTLHSSQGPHAYDLRVERTVKPLSAEEAGVGLVWLGLKRAMTEFDAPQAVYDVFPQRN